MSLANDLKRKGYKLISNLGEGSFSKVKLATSHKYQSNVAIKIVDRTKAPKDFVQNFLPRERDILRLVKHDHIIQLHEFIELPGKRLGIVMEVAAKDLLQKIHEVNRLSIDQCKTFFCQMVSAVSYLHQMDIVHRDLKCENILLTAEEQIKITDFGFARRVPDPTELSQTFCGSAPYTPPEVLMSTPYCPKKFDVWSLGVTLYIMVTGTMPYDDTSSERILQLQRKPLAFPDDLGVEEPSQVFIRTLLQFSPFTRPTIQQVEEHPWMQTATPKDKNQ